MSVYTHMHTIRLVTLCHVEFTTTDRLTLAVEHHCPETLLLVPGQCRVRPLPLLQTQS